PHLNAKKTVLSLASGVSIQTLQEAVDGRCPVVRVMPNTPALVGAGVFALCLEDPTLCEETRTAVLDLFTILGSTVVLPEKRFKAFTALVGCGPAYVFHFMDALAEAGVTLGFSRKESLELVTQLVLGSAKLAAVSGKHPALLREDVCSPAGVTIAAINHMDRTALRGHLIDAILTAHERS
ncbi:MAG: pyrroline-5-carboxylate reductase dimerization domain-containing protein, partial [Bilophila sp.]